ncbi:MAG TPA: MG2 domain-containing protein [Kofleriaceae bacterium]|nr:MG2 domain-containing protein [Kofleriaceae bacterium]
MMAALKPVALQKAGKLDDLDKKIVDYFARTQTRRGYLMTDKPLYQPGETIWLRADVRMTGTLKGTATGASLSLVSPRGAVVAQKRVMVTDGVAQNDFALAADIEGGEYTIQLAADDGTQDQKKIIINTYEAPRLQKTVELTKKAYGAGDSVVAAIEIKRATGEAFANRALTGVVTIDDIEVARLPIKTDAGGKAMAKFQLPGSIARGDGLLTVMAEDGGVTESIQKRIPIVMKSISMSLFPEGGDLVTGVPGRVYFMAKTPLGKPADLTGRVIDDRGIVVAKLESIHDGMGKFELTPMADRTYHVEIDRPVGIAQKFDVPAAKEGGCVVRSVDGGAADKLRIATICSTSTVREKRLADAAVEVEAGKPALVELPVAADAQGAVRVTLFSAKQEPLAERLVYHGRGRDLKITLAADKKQYTPRDGVKLHVHTTDAAGKPVKANVGVAVVDDTVLSFADDKSAKILAHFFLEPELGATAQDPIEEPNFYFGTKPEAQAAMDALLATRGYRRFEWQQVMNPPPPPPVEAYTEAAAIPQAAPPMDMVKEEERPMRKAAAGRGPMPPPPPAQAAPVGKVKAEATKAPVVRQIERADKDLAKNNFAGRAHLAIAGGEQLDDEGEGQWQNGLSPVRVFPVPEYSRGYEGPRNDFRETIYWNPAVQTDASGDATVQFPVSDAVTSFRATAEGVSANGQPGIGEATIQSKMPLSLDVHMPVEVTSGDEIKLPITLTNETDHAVDADLKAQFGAAFKVGTQLPPKLHIEAHDKASLFVPLSVVATDGDADVHLAVATAGLEDKLDKKIHVVPLGVPFEASASGTAKTGVRAHHDFDLGGALPGSIQATVTMYPSPLAAMTKGMEGMIREPGGCFEQTSSTNYPNVMVLSYLASNDAADPQLVQSANEKLDHGYKLLTGYETPEKGYEWFGHSPGHEALTAYGLMEFADMAKVYDVDHSMVERTAGWLMSRRDGKGGFLRSAEAIDSFGRASETTTNAYIMWALSEAHRTKGMDTELAAQRKNEASADPYLLALATNTALLNGGGADAVKRLAGMQGKDGSFTGAKESITMSGGESLAIETTALATLALIKASPNSEYEPQIRAAVDFLNSHRSGFGEWGNTQATILGLKALTAYAEHSRQMQAPGTATLIVNGQRAGAISFDKGRKDALVWNDLASLLKPGKNTVELELAGGATLPYTIAIEYRSAKPASSEHAKVYVSTQLAKDHLKMGEGVKLHAHVENRTADGLPMTLARIGIPGGLTFQTWQLKELRDKHVIDFYETRPREVILYWGAMAPSSHRDIDLDLLAQSAGTYESPATSAYLYYTAEDKAWTAPTKVSIER